MASEMRFASGASAVYYSGTGRVSGGEVLASASSLLSLVRASPVTRILVDLSLAATVDISTSQLRDVAAIHVETSRFCSGARVALVAAEAHVFGLARMWDVFVEASGWEIQLFQDRESAVTWLGIPSSPENCVALDLLL